MPMQETPICFDCRTPVHNMMVYEAPCGHMECPSVVWHGACLMGWRERAHREAQEEGGRSWFEVIAFAVRRWSSEHTDGP